jgi:hypothetical protein
MPDLAISLKIYNFLHISSALIDIVNIIALESHSHETGAFGVLGYDAGASGEVS